MFSSSTIDFVSQVMALQSKVILFGDQTVDPCPLIKQLWRSSSHHTVLQTFFERTADGLRRELAFAQFADRSDFPDFHSIPSLVDTYSQSHKPDEAVATVLLCVYQLALLLTCDPQHYACPWLLIIVWLLGEKPMTNLFSIRVPLQRRIWWDYVLACCRRPP